MHIYIYTYIKGRELVRCCKHMLFVFSHVSDFSSVCSLQGPVLPLIQPYPSLSAASLGSGFYL